MSSIVGNDDSFSACGTYRLMSSRMTDRLMLNVSSTSSSTVGSGTIIIPMIATTTTDANGAYSFTDLAAGSYAVKVPTDLGGRTLARDNVAHTSPPGSIEPVYDSDFFTDEFNGVAQGGPSDGRSAFYTLSSSTVQPNIDASYGFYFAAPANGVVDGAAAGAVQAMLALLGVIVLEVKAVGDKQFATRQTLRVLLTEAAPQVAFVCV